MDDSEARAGGVLHGLPPIVGPGARVLVLGSFPSGESLRKGQYYGHPRNHFWELVARATGWPCPPDYEERKAWLIGLGIALWDTIASCERLGSLDRAIRGAVPNDIAAFLRARPSIAILALNGSRAAAEYHRLTGLPPIGAIVLPSSSPVPSRTYRGLADKVPSWTAALSSRK